MSSRQPMRLLRSDPLNAMCTTWPPSSVSSTTNLPSGALITAALLNVNSPSGFGSLALTVVAMGLLLIRWSRLAVSGNELPFGSVFGKSDAGSLRQTAANP
jgi:hypothetical protein